MNVCLPSNALDAPYLNSLPAKIQKRVLGRAEDMVQETATILEPYLSLPNKVMIGFDDSDVEASAIKRRLIFGIGGIGLLARGLADNDSIKGLIAHELSHISDVHTGNDCLGPSILHGTISEGKAEAVGVFVGGDRFESLQCDTLDPHEKHTVYTALLAKNRRANATFPNPRRVLNDAGGYYRVGLSLVSDIVRISPNVEDILDIHAQPFEYFKSNLCLLVGRTS